MSQQSRRDQILARHAKELEQLDREEQIAGCMQPFNLPEPRFIHTHTKGSEHIVYESKTLGEAVQKFLQFREMLIPAIYYVGQYHHWEPKELIERRKNQSDYDGAKKEMDTVAEIRVESIFRSSDKVKLSYWINLPGFGIVEVSDEINGYNPPIGLRMKATPVGVGANSRNVARWDEPKALQSYWHERTRVGRGDKNSVDARFYWCWDMWEHEFLEAMRCIQRMIGEPVFDGEE